MEGCPVHKLRAKLRAARLRPTRQRVALGWLLFGKGDRHVTAEMLFEEAKAAKAPVSLATIYNTLHQFTGAGLLMEIAIDGPRTYFDTNPTAASSFPDRGDRRARRYPRRPCRACAIAQGSRRVRNRARRHRRAGASRGRRTGPVGQPAATQNGA